MIRFDYSNLTPTEIVYNNSQKDKLIKNQEYRFNPPIQASIASIGRKNTGKIRSFSSGKFIGCKEHSGVINYIFFGKPVDSSDREAFFCINIGKGSTITPITEEPPKVATTQIIFLNSFKRTKTPL